MCVYIYYINMQLFMYSASTMDDRRTDRRTQQRYNVF